VVGTESNGSVQMRPMSVVLFAAVVVWGGWLPAAGEPPTPTPKPAEKPADWQADPVCHMVFFAVLEGLYRDGVPDEVVDSIVPRHPKEGQNPVKTSFVFQCPLCHPVYEAFALYQRRPAFSGEDKKRDTFGKGIDPELVTALKSENAKTRLGALATLVHRWVEHRLTMMRLTDAEKQEWVKKLGERSNQGQKHLSDLLGTDPAYKGWSTYWGCAACKGTTGACQAVKTSDPKR
jgi:hypothetical protein